MLDLTGFPVRVNLFIVELKLRSNEAVNKQVQLNAHDEISTELHSVPTAPQQQSNMHWYLKRRRRKIYKRNPVLEFHTQLESFAKLLVTQLFVQIKCRFMLTQTAWFEKQFMVSSLRFPESIDRLTSPWFLVLLPPLAYPVQVDLIVDPGEHHYGDHHAQDGAEDPHALRCATPAAAGSHCEPKERTEWRRVLASDWEDPTEGLLRIK